MGTAPSHRRTVRPRLLLAVAALAVAAVACEPVPVPEGAPPPMPTEPPAADAPAPPTTTKERRRRRNTPTTTAAPRPAPTTTAAPAPRPAPTTTVAAPSPGGDPLPVGPAATAANWRLRFRDEFNGTGLDTSKWQPNWLGRTDSAVTQPINTAEESCYAPSQVSVSGGTLRLEAKRLSSPLAGCKLRNGRDAQYVSGMVQTDGRHNFSYGYTEARIFLPGNASRAHNWAAFWTTGQDWPRTGEIDIMETLEGDPTWTYHYGTSSNPRSINTSQYNLLADKSGWHTFGVDWAPGSLTFYYDGRKVGEVRDPAVVSSPHYIVLNYGLSTTPWASERIDVPSVMQVDYVRHWQRA